jgi:hypothetical protein
VLSLALIAAACGKKDDGSATKTTTAGASTTATPAGGVETTPSDGSSPAATIAAPPETTPKSKPVSGGSITISGEAEVANPWTPAAMQCDSYCQERARSFYDPIAAIGADLKVHPYLAESITPNADATIWTVKIRSGISELR